MRPLRSDITRVVLAGHLVLLCACQTIAGYDGREPRPADMDAGTTPDVDGGNEPVPSPNCVALGVSSCAPATPHCSIYYDATLLRHTYSCISDETQASAPKAQAPCGVAPLECADGLACGYSWHSGYRCAPVCKTNADCDPARPFCNHPLTLIAELGPLSLCAACDPILQKDCTGQLDTCVARSVTAEPTCGNVAPGAGGIGASCTSASQCQAGLFCVCNAGQGLGDDCASAKDGMCRRACRPSDRGSVCPAEGGQPSPGTCSSVGTTALYSYCKP